MVSLQGLTDLIFNVLLLYSSVLFVNLFFSISAFISLNLLDFLNSLAEAFAFSNLDFKIELTESSLLLASLLSLVFNSFFELEVFLISASA